MMIFSRKSISNDEVFHQIPVFENQSKMVEIFTLMTYFEDTPEMVASD